MSATLSKRIIDVLRTTGTAGTIPGIAKAINRSENQVRHHVSTLEFAGALVRTGYVRTASRRTPAATYVVSKDWLDWRGIA